MKLKDLQIENQDDYVKVTDLENFFNVYKDVDGHLKYNLNETLQLDVDEDYMSFYKLSHDMFWPLISYKIYSTTRLAWLLMKVNKVKPDDAFAKVPASTTVMYIPSQYLDQIVRIMQEH